MNGKLESVSEWIRKRPVVVLLLVAGYTFLLFSPTLLYDFVYDDVPTLLENPTVTDPSLLLRGGALSNRSVRTLTFSLDHALWGERPLGYHLTNVLLHVLVVVSLSALLRPLVREPILAWLAALFFACHPVHAEVVAGIANRKDSLALLFGLLSTLFFVFKRRCLFCYGLSLVCLFLSFLSKEIVAIAFPLVFIATDLLANRGGGDERVSWRRLSLYYAPILLAGPLYLWWSGHWALWEYFDRGHLTSVLPQGEAGWVYVLARAMRALGYNARLLYLPWGYSAEYAMPWDPASAGAPGTSPFAPTFELWLGLAHAIALPVLLIRYRRRLALPWAIAFFLLTYLPVSGLVPFTERLIADRYLYTPSVGYSVLLALAAGAVLRRSPRSGAALSLSIVAVLSASTLVHTRPWRDSLSLWGPLARSPTATPSAVANFTFACLREQEYDRGIRAAVDYLKQFQGKIIEEPALYANFAACLREAGELDESTFVLFSVIRAFPEDELIKKNLAVNAERYHRAREYDKSAGILEEFLSGRISSSRGFLGRAHHLMGLNAAAQGEVQEARAHLSESVKILPRAEVYCALAELAIQSGRRSVAEAHLSSALRLDPAHERARTLSRRIREAEVPAAPQEKPSRR